MSDQLTDDNLIVPVTVDYTEIQKFTSKNVCAVCQSRLDARPTKERNIFEIYCIECLDPIIEGGYISTYELTKHRDNEWTTRQLARSKGATNPMNDLVVIHNDELNKPSNLIQFERMLGKRGAASFISGILTSVKDNPKLLECPPENIASEALKGAAYNLPIGSSFGMSWLVPRYSSQHKSQMATWQPGYKGLKQMAMRSGDHVIINVGELFPGQGIEADQLTGQVNITGKNEGGEPVGYFGYLKKVNGYEGFVYWSMERILAHKKAYAKGTTRKDSPWNNSPVSMYKKTVLANLLNEHATFEFDLQEVAADVMEIHAEAEAGDDQLTTEANEEVIDGEAIEHDPLWDKYAEVKNPEGKAYKDISPKMLTRMRATLKSVVAQTPEPRTEEELESLTDLQWKLEAIDYYIEQKEGK